MSADGSLHRVTDAFIQAGALSYRSGENIDSHCAGGQHQVVKSLVDVVP